MEQQREEAEKILSWRDMHQGVYRYHGIEHRGTNDYGKPVSVVTLETEKGVNMYYAPASLYWDLMRRTETSFFLNMKAHGLLTRVMITPFSSLPNERRNSIKKFSRVMIQVRQMKGVGER